MPEPAETEHPLEGSTVLVTGATGFTGGHLVRKLVDASADVHGIARPSSEIDDELYEAVTWHRGDVYDAEVVEDAMAGVDYVFHMATCYRDGGAPDREHRRVHVESTRLLAEAAQRQPEFERFVHVSTVGVHGHIEEPPADEDAPFNPGDIYQETKLEGELWIREYADKAGLPLAVLRPAAIMGPDDRRLLKLFRFARYGVFPLLDGHDPQYHLIHVDDLTDIMILAAHNPEAEGEVFICGNAEPSSAVAILSQVGELLDTRLRFVPVPARPVFLLADAVERIADLLDVEPILYRRRVAFFTKDRAFDTRKLQDVLGFEHRFDNEAAVRDTARGYIEAGWL